MDAKHPFTEEEIEDLYWFSHRLAQKRNIIDADEWASHAFATILQECAAFQDEIKDINKYIRIEIAKYLKRIKIQRGKDAGRTVVFQDYDAETTNQHIENTDVINEYYKECDYYRFNQTSKYCLSCHTKKPKFGSFCSINHRLYFYKYLRYKHGLSDKKILRSRSYKCTHCKKRIHWSIKRRSLNGTRKFCNNRCKKAYYRDLQGVCPRCQVVFIKKTRGQKFCTIPCGKKYHKEISRKSRLTIFSDDSMICV